jgi:hypothetical protein
MRFKHCTAAVICFITEGISGWCMQCKTMCVWYRTLMCVLSEMLQTERDYISSLKFVIDSYMSEFSRADLPQALRGKRHIVFGNWEKIYDFHSRYFIAELEQCELSPYQIAQCFLDHVSVLVCLYVTCSIPGLH